MSKIAVETTALNTEEFSPSLAPLSQLLSSLSCSNSRTIKDQFASLKLYVRYSSRAERDVHGNLPIMITLKDNGKLLSGSLSELDEDAIEH